MNTVLTIAQYELRRLFMTRRGLLSLLAFALIWFLILRYPIYTASQFFQADAPGGMIASFLNSSTMHNLLRWQVPELAVYWVMALYLFPIFGVVLTADQTASDRARGTLRLLNLRATRDGIFFGRFLGQLLILLMLIVLSLASTIVLVLLRDSAMLAVSLDLSAVILVNLMLVLLPYTALMAWVSSMAKSARQATLYAVIIWIVCSMLTGWLARQFPGISVLDMILPGAQVQSLLQLSGWNTLSQAPIPLIQTVVLLVLGRMIMQRSDW